MTKKEVTQYMKSKYKMDKDDVKRLKKENKRLREQLKGVKK